MSFDSFVGRTNALELTAVDGRTVARRFTVEHGADGGARRVSEAPVEELSLPIRRGAAAAWLQRHFDDLGPEWIGELAGRFARPTGPLA